MKRILFSSLPVLALVIAIAPAGQAQSPSNLSSDATSTVAVTSATLGTTTENTTPFQLVNLASNGYLKDQGIPGSGDLAWEARTGDITAKTLIQAAIQANRVPATTINNGGYVNAVQLDLDDLNRPKD